MAAKVHSEEAWAMVRAGWETDNLSYEAAGRLGGIPTSTVRVRALDEGWVRSNGLKAGASRTEVQAVAAAMTEANNLANVRRKGEMVEAFVETVFKLRDQLDEPFLQREVKVVAQGSVGPGMTEPHKVEIVDVWLPTPPPSDKQRLITSMAILVDKIQLITGEATSRQENIIPDRDEALERVRHLRDELAERRAANDPGGLPAGEGEGATG